MTSLTVVMAAVALAAGPGGGPAGGWPELAPLMGEWTGGGSGQPGEGAGGFTLRPDLGGQVLVRRSFSEYPASKDRPAARHEDLMVVFREGGALKATYFDNEGHVIRYGVTVQGARAVFLSEPGPGPRFRLTYDWSAGASAVKILFELAMPSAPEKFARYVEGTAKRRGD